MIVENLSHIQLDIHTGISFTSCNDINYIKYKFNEIHGFQVSNN